MNRLIPLLLILTLLCGCAAQNPDIQPMERTVPSVTEASEVLGFYDADSILEIQSAGALQAFPLQGRDISGFLLFGDNILLLSSTGTGTRLELLTSDILTPLYSITLDFSLTTESSNITYCSQGISFFDSNAMQTVVLDHSLQELRRIDVPDDLTGMPVMSFDGSILYYCTASAVRALDLDTGINRIVKESEYPAQNLAGLLLEDSVIRLQITDQDSAARTLFLSSQTGQLLSDFRDTLNISSSDMNFYTKFYRAGSEMLMFGNRDDMPQLLLPENPGICFFLENSHSAITFSHSRNGQTVLDHYNLSSGRRTASTVLEEVLHPSEAVSAADGSIWFLSHSDYYGCSTLFRWQPEKSLTEDSHLYTTSYHTQQEPDYEALSACTAYAQDISARHGVEVLVYKDAVALQPWDYDLEYEYMAPVLQKELELLDARLSNYPDGFLQTLAGKFTGIKICIVHEIRGSPESGSTASADGIQFWNGYDAHIVLAAGHDTDRTLYHELCHLIDTVVLTESIAYDQWEKMNPSGFRYAFSASHSMDANDWLQAGWDSFVDNHAMVSPKDDRARIMEYAMIDGNEELFLSPYLQAKLKQLCVGIRDAFGLQNVPEPFLWEQYLQIPLTDKK